MPDTFFASDHHFGHANILNFTNYDGTPVRKFDNVEHMNSVMIERHNARVRPSDTVWFLGDVVMNRRFLQICVPQLNGRKRLILGNHDIFSNKDYFNAGFEDINAFRKFDGFVCTHIPVHRESLRPSWGKNVHGHLHNNVVPIVQGFNCSTEPDPDYINISVERIDYTPVSIDELRKMF